METIRSVSPTRTQVSAPTRMRLFLSAARYLAGKALTILATIFAGVFVTLLIVNYPAGPDIGTSPFEQNLEGQIYTTVQIAIYQGVFSLDANGPVQSEVDAFTDELRAEAGLNLPFLPRYLFWTVKALTFNWGRLDSGVFPQLGIGQGLRSQPTAQAVLQYFPNTLLLVGTAYFLTFLLGMPLALYLARHYGSGLDRIFSVLSPISSVPSWVFAALLITIFAVQLRWLPVGGMFDFHKPEQPLQYAWALLRHMVLPVSALLLSLLFQLVYTWRTFFIIYSEEDYVELARAKGLDIKALEKQYILKPALPYVITSFATSLIGFWQLTVALEKIFQWPGIGMLYIEALPNYWHETVEYGDLMIVVQIVVTFSCILGILAFILDLVYVIVDPRIHLVPASSTAQTNASLQTKTRRWNGLFARVRGKTSGLAQPVRNPIRRRAVLRGTLLRSIDESLREMGGRGELFFQQLRKYPSAIFGLSIITLLFAGSIYAFVFLPYEQIGRNYDAARSPGRNLLPRTAGPLWFNIFSTKPYLSTLILDEQDAQASVSSVALDNGWVQKTVTFQFDYNYREIPSEVFIYLDSRYVEKIPFVSMQWTTPDGRIIKLKTKAVAGDDNYDMHSSLNISRLLNENPQWKNWFVRHGQYPTPPFYMLFAKPDSAEPVPQPGTYQLEITTLLFEDGSDFKPQLVLLGQVYGLAGTDYWRRDLVVPLFWGMPITLLVGFIGTFITTLIAMLLPAIGVWFGGWLDNFIQRLTEINMVLPGLAIATLINAIFGIHIWIVLGIVVVLNAFGAPIKSFRSAFLQAKEAPYIEMARSYGAGNFRIITRYLVPRILPVLIPTLVAQIPSFIFLEATLGFFNIKTNYPSWGRIIYDGLSRGALYGSPFWVLEPIFLLLLTGLAFAMLGSALERVLNPRVIDQGSVQKIASRKTGVSIFVNRRTAAGLIALLILFVVVSSGKAKTVADSIMERLSPQPASASNKPARDPETLVSVPSPTAAALPTRVTVTFSEASTTPTSPPPAPTAAATAGQFATQVAVEPIVVPTTTISLPDKYVLQRGEYPYCIARRFDIDPTELLRFNGLARHQNYFAGLILRIPDAARSFPGRRQLQTHPGTYAVSLPDETLYSVACAYGDVDPEAIASANQLSVNSALVVGQKLTIP